MIKLSQFLNDPIDPFIYGALMSRIVVSKDRQYFATISSYQKSNRFSFQLAIISYLKTNSI